MTPIASAFWKSARISREDLYAKPQDDQTPANLIEDASVPFLGFAGPHYTSGGVVLLAINPGGGGEAYKVRTAQDSKLLPLIEAFVRGAAAEAPSRFDAMSKVYAEQVKSWNLWRILAPVLAACGKDLNEVAYLNCFPYRTAGDRMPMAGALRNSWTRVVDPILTVLGPSTVIALGKKAGGVAERYFHTPAKLFVVPRTIGDTRISQEAEVVLKSLKQHAT